LKRAVSPVECLVIVGHKRITCSAGLKIVIYFGGSYALFLINGDDFGSLHIEIKIEFSFILRMTEFMYSTGGLSVGLENVNVCGVGILHYG